MVKVAAPTVMAANTKSRDLRIIKLLLQITSMDVKAIIARR